MYLDIEKSKAIGVDLFGGAGGMAYGASMAGVDVRLAVESDNYAAMTYSHNHPNTSIIKKDIKKIKGIEINCNGKYKILFGGPPCQGFSTSNQKTRTLNNDSNWLFNEFIRIAKHWNPDCIIFENVKGLVDTCGGYFFSSVVKRIEALHYKVVYWILDAEKFGVPQRRNRLFIIGTRDGITPVKPVPFIKKTITVNDAISDLPILENGNSINWLPYQTKASSKYAKYMRASLLKSSNHLVTKNYDYVIERYKYIPQGGNWKNIPERLMKNYRNRNNCHTGIYYRLQENEPSIVIGNYRKNMLVHPTQNRGLSVREAARLQSFPDNYEFKGSIGYQQQQVGNAVPPVLAKVVFESIINLINK
jgi:DNA (cytosine-5)-methyltransferase 1